MVVRKAAALENPKQESRELRRYPLHPRNSLNLVGRVFSKRFFKKTPIFHRGHLHSWVLENFDAKPVCLHIIPLSPKIMVQDYHSP
uniref:Uncharacterized protein n=1 Tax=Anguilla anguilla TaxID=7936 RepID=A0A0E9WQ77_ANGAN